MSEIRNLRFTGNAGPFPVAVTVSVAFENCMYCRAKHPNFEMFNVWKGYGIGRWTLFKRRIGFVCKDCASIHNLQIIEGE